MEGSRNSAANAAVSAVALATLSNIRLAPKTMRKAQQEYTKALSMTNLALQDPLMCRTDDTLAAVVMLGIFEVSMPQNVNALPTNLGGRNRS